MEIYDLTEAPLSRKNGIYGGLAGHKDGILIDGEEWLIKYPKNITYLEGTGGASYSTSPLSEFIGSHVFAILGFDVHRTILAERRNKIVVACKDFTDCENLLFEIRTVKNHANEQMSEEFEREFKETGDKHHIDLEELLMHLRYNPILSVIEDIEERFWEQAIIDVLINNNDRNNGNWGIIRNIRNAEVPDKLAPIFDNGGSFQTKSSEEKIQKQLSDEKQWKASAIGIVTAYSQDGHVYSASKFLDLVSQEAKLREALLRLGPRIKEGLPSVLEFIDSIPEVHTLRNGEIVTVCSEARKRLYKKQLVYRYEKLIVPAILTTASIESSRKILGLV